MEQSQSFSLNKNDAKKIFKGALIAGGGALMTYLSSVVTQMDFGQLTPIVVSFWSIIVNVITKYIQNEQGRN